MTPPTTLESLSAIIAAHLTETPLAPLIIPGLAENLYRDYPADNISALKKFDESDKAYRYAIANPTDPTDDMIMGTIIHFLTLQSHRPESDCFVVSPFPDFRTKPAQEWRDSQTKPIITAAKLELARATVDTIRNHPRVAWMLEHEKDGVVHKAQTEVSAFKRHPRTGLLLKGRADMVFMDSNDMTAIGDLKKVQSLKKALFAKDIGERLHHAAAAFYNDLFGASTHCLIAAKIGPPADARVFPLGGHSIEIGRVLYEKWLDRLVKCRATNHWPGIDEDSEELIEIEAPAWAQREAEALP